MAANGVVVWEWQNEYGKWQPYSPQISSFIESQQSSGQPLPLGQVDSSLYHYTVDLNNMCQTRQGIGTQRAIRRSIYPTNSPIAHGITWQWEADVAGKWHDFDIEVATYLEDCLNKNNHQVDLMAKFSLPYHIDLKNMTQMRIHTGRVRKIQKTFTAMSYPYDTNSGTVSVSQNGLKRKTVINKNAALKKSKISFPASSGLVPPQTMPINGLVSLPNVSMTQGTLPQPSVIGTQSVQGPLTRNRLNQTVSAFTAQNSTHSGMPGSSPSSAPVSAAAGNQVVGNQSLFGGSWHFPSTLPYQAPSNMGSQTSSFGFQPSNFLNFLPTATGQSGSQPFMFGSQPGTLSFNPTQLLSRSRGSRIRPSNPVATNVSAATPGLANPQFQQSPFQTGSATVPSAAFLPKHARIPNNVPKGGKGSKQCLTADDILHNYVTVVGTSPANEDCCICYEKLTEPSGQGTGGPQDKLVLQLEKCSHMFHKLCLDALFNSGPKDGSLQCPSCKTIYGEKMGNCPRGEMEYFAMNHSLAGYEDCKTIQILYHIQSGIQGDEHPHPGKRYSTRGFPRIGYLPDNEKGRKVLQLLIVAWKRRLTFTIGMSTTTGEGDTVTWNEIHHKTEHSSNYSGHGYPDPNYLDNVLLELAVHGITEKDLPS